MININILFTFFDALISQQTPTLKSYLYQILFLWNVTNIVTPFLYLMIHIYFASDLSSVIGRDYSDEHWRAQ